MSPALALPVYVSSEKLVSRPLLRDAVRQFLELGRTHTAGFFQVFVAVLPKVTSYAYGAKLQHVQDVRRSPPRPSLPVRSIPQLAPLVPLSLRPV
jgi:hypothetical protein